MLRERKVISVYHFIGFTVAVALCALLEEEIIKYNIWIKDEVIKYG